MERKHEQSIIDGFFNQLFKIAKQNNRNLIRCSMDGQDSILGGDYIFTNNTKFVLAEFKYEASNLKSENKKTKRLNLCLNLDKTELYRNLSLKCHYIAWSEKRHTRTIFFNQYYSEICNQDIFGKDSNLKLLSSNVVKVTVDTIINDFFNQNIGTNYFSFKKYIDWLLNLDSGGKTSSIEIILDNPDSQQFELLDFNNLDSLKQWIDINKPIPPEPTQSFSPRM